MLKEPDEFITTTTDALSWAAQHSRLLILIGVALLAALSAVLIVRQVQASQQEKANEMFGQANVLYNAVIDPTGQGIDADGVRHEVLFKNAEDKFSKSLESFAAVNAKYPRTSVGRLSLLFCGHCAMELGRYEEARDYYQRFIASGFEDTFMRQLAQLSLSQAFVAGGDFASAASALELLAGEANEGLRPSVLFSLGQCYENDNKREQALEAYGKIVKEYGGAELAQMAMQRIEALGGNPFEGQGEPGEPQVRVLPTGVAPDEAAVEISGSEDDE